MPTYVKKIRVAVEVAEPGREPLQGILALDPRVAGRPGAETVLDLLNAPQRVIPLERPEGSAVLLTRMQIGWVLAGESVERALVWPRTYRVTREERVLAEMDDGALLSGRIQMELPESLNRASDFLNAAEDFFPLIARQGVYLVNKAKLRAIQLFEASPMPVEAV